MMSRSRERHAIYDWSKTRGWLAGGRLSCADGVH